MWFVAKSSGDALVIFLRIFAPRNTSSRESMGAHKKQRIFSILAILTMAVILTCVFAACNKTGAQEKSFTITFDSMGGSNVSSITIKDGETLVMPADPTKPGYVFAGWYLDRNYSSLFSATTAINGNITVYAKWQEVLNDFENIVFENKTYSYDGKPHSLSISGYPEGTAVSFDVSNTQTMVGVYVITATLTKTGYATKSYTATLTIDKGIIDTSKFKFEDKQFQQDGTPKSLKLVGELPYGVTVEYINNDQTLDGVYTVTAHFVYDRDLYYEVQDMTATMTIVTPLTQYRINYELYSGVNSGKNPTTYLSPNEKEIKLYPATRSAWIFDGWYRNEQYEGSPITELPKNTSGDIYLYAKWVKPYVIASDDAFTITGKTITATVGHDVSMYSFIESFNACSDCTWSLYSDYLGTNELVLKNMQLNYGMNTAYIVVWSEDRSVFTQYTLNVYRLSMRQYSYSVLGKIVDSGEIEEQSALSAPENPDVQHYIFEGWYIGEQKIEFPYVVNVDSNIVAKMTPLIVIVTVEFNSNGGSKVESRSGEGRVVIETEPKPTNGNFTFGGWYTDQKLSNRAEFPFTATMNVTLYAKWNSSTITVRFDVNAPDVNPVTEYKIEMGSKITLPTNVVREGYDFVGWFEDQACTVAVAQDKVYTKDTTLFAGYRIRKYTVTFDLAGGKYYTFSNGKENPPKDKVVVEYEYGATIKNLPIADRENHVEGFYRENFVFRYWEMDGEQYSLDTMPAANITITATWNIKDPSTFFELSENSDGNYWHCSADGETIVVWKKEN